MLCAHAPINSLHERTSTTLQHAKPTSWIWQNAEGFPRQQPSLGTHLVLPVDVGPGLEESVQRVSVAEARGLPQLFLHDERRRRHRDQRRAQLPRGEHDRGRQVGSGRCLGLIAVESLSSKGAEKCSSVFALQSLTSVI